MIFALISLVLFLILLIFAVRIGLNKNKPEEEERYPAVIHASGIYSIVRRDPREAVHNNKPRTEEIRKYLSLQNVDTNGLPLSEADREKLFAFWNESLNASIQEIEGGDREGVEFYYYDFPHECPVCDPFLKKGQFVTREELFQNPTFIPPFHLGCTCKINAYHGSENLRDTTELGMRPLFENNNPPSLPSWTKILRIP
jgi:hypothetical protein